MGNADFQATIHRHPKCGKLVEIADRRSGLSLTAAPEQGFVCAGIELLHPKRGPVQLLHNANWFPADVRRGASPILFPLVGRARLGKQQGVYKIGGQSYRMDLHGFAKDMPWELVGVGTDGESAFVTARLTDSTATRKAYPFGFSVEMTYRLQAGAVLLEALVDSEGPYCLGYHPYFRTPIFPDNGRKSGCALKVPAGLMWELADSVPTGVKTPLPDKWPLAGGMKMGADDLDIVLGDLETDAAGVCRCELTDRPGGLRIAVESDAHTFPVVVIYSPAEGPFTCIEPWTAPPNALNNHWGLLSPLTQLASVVRIVPEWLER